MEIIYDPKPLTAEELHLVSQDVKRVLTDLYGDRLDRVILFGSYARGDLHKESDVDYLAVLKDSDFAGGQEIRRIAPVIGPLALHYEVEISILPTSVLTYETGHALLYQSIRQEGICL